MFKFTGQIAHTEVLQALGRLQWANATPASLTEILTERRRATRGSFGLSGSLVMDDLRKAKLVTKWGGMYSLRNHRLIGYTSFVEECNYTEHGRKSVPAIACVRGDAGAWHNVCAEHFASEGHSLGTNDGILLVVTEDRS